MTHQLAVLHHRHENWVPALREAAPDLDIRGWHPREWESADREWLRTAGALFCWKIPPGFLALMPGLRWAQNSGAGVDHLVNHPELAPHVAITRADGEFGFWMARYACGHLLAEAQRLDACRAAQAEAFWDPKLLPEDLSGKMALVLGFGRIGRQIGLALRDLGMDVHGIVRTPRLDDAFPLHGTDELPVLLPSARTLILAAPATTETRGIVDAGMLAHGNADLTLINIGRGELVDHSALLEALDAGRLGHAVLDVFLEEPLPAESPLWRHPKITVTPHHSGPSTPAQIIPNIQDNLRRYALGEAIVDAVDRVRGY